MRVGLPFVPTTTILTVCLAGRPGLRPDRLAVQGGGGLQVHRRHLRAVHVDVRLSGRRGPGHHPGDRAAGERPDQGGVLGTARTRPTAEVTGRGLRRPGAGPLRGGLLEDDRRAGDRDVARTVVRRHPPSRRHRGLRRVRGGGDGGAVGPGHRRGQAHVPEQDGVGRLPLQRDQDGRRVHGAGAQRQGRLGGEHRRGPVGDHRRRSRHGRPARPVGGPDLHLVAVSVAAADVALPVVEATTCRPRGAPHSVLGIRTRADHDQRSPGAVRDDGVSRPRRPCPADKRPRRPSGRGPRPPRRRVLRRAPGASTRSARCATASRGPTRAR